MPPIQSPSRFFPCKDARVLVPAAGGETDPHRISKLRNELAELAHPVGPHLANADLCLRIISLGNDTAIALFADLESSRPVNAKENALRKLLLERWAIADPEGEARWVVEHGSGMDRESMPLALSRLALTDPELAFEFARFLPEDSFVARFAIVNAVATRSHREACEIGKAHDCQIHEVYQDWRRIDPDAANEWLKARWMDRY